MRGFIDHVSHRLVRGWVLDEGEPGTPVSLLVMVDGATRARVLANIYREDLEKAGFGNGRHGFYVALGTSSGLEPITVRLVREADGADVPGSPIILDPARFDMDMQERLAVLLADSEDEAELAARAAFLAQQADRLLQRRADLRAGRPDPWAPRQFRVRWTGKGAPPVEPGPRLLVIDETMPRAGRDAGSNAIMSHMLSFRRLGYRVVFAPADMSGGEAADALAAAGIDCACRPWCGSVEEVLRREASGFSAVYVHRGINARYLPMVRLHQPKAWVMFGVADLQHVRLARQAEVERRPELQAASQRVRVAELSAARMADAVITHSEFEAALLRRDLPQARVHVVPWSVPVRPTAVPLLSRRGLAFIGNYAHLPNLDAAWWLVQEVMPAIRALKPGMECRLVGSGMPDALRAVSAPGIAAVGHVQDLSALFDAVRLTVAPLTFGAGLKGKVLDSFAAGVPCVCTPVAAEGMALPPPLEALVASGAGAIAEAVVRVHDDLGLNGRASDAGLAFIGQYFTDERVDRVLRGVLPVQERVGG